MMLLDKVKSRPNLLVIFLDIIDNDDNGIVTLNSLLQETGDPLLQENISEIILE